MTRFENTRGQFRRPVVVISVEATINMFAKIAVLSSIFWIANTAENCDHLGTLLYEDLHCQPVIPAGAACPSHYTCDDFATTREHCLFQSRRLAVGEVANNNITYSACEVACHCTLQKDAAGFECAALDCPEWLGVPLPGPDCYPTYSLGQCCSTGHKCPPFSGVECISGNVTHKEGESFYTTDSCHMCVCRAGFEEGKLESPFCQRITCVQQIRNADKLARNCAPVYLGAGARCCPSEWACPASGDEIRQIHQRKDSDLTCKWGEKQLKLGEGLRTKVDYFGTMKEVTCECVLPPFLTCEETTQQE